MMKPKLLVTASTFPRWREDSEPRFVLDLCEALADEFDVTVLVPWAIGAERDEVMNGVNVHRYHYFPIHSLETLCYPGAIVPRIKEKKTRALLVPFLLLSLWINLIKYMPRFEYVHAHWIIPQGIIQSLFKKEYILTGHGSDVVSLNKGLLLKLKQRALKNAKCVTVVSGHLEKTARNICPNANIQVLSMGCWTSHFDPKYRIENYFGQNGKKVILFVGRLVEIKGVIYLIKAMEYIDALLIIVGKGPLETALRQEAKAYNNKIVFAGSKTHDELKSIYSSADIFVAPSITVDSGGQEGFGLVLLEAMASGLPVVASCSGGIPDIVVDGKNGFLTEEKSSEDLAEKINYLLSNDVLYDKMRMNALNTADGYDYSIIAKKYSQLLKG